MTSPIGENSTVRVSVPFLFQVIGTVIAIALAFAFVQNGVRDNETKVKELNAELQGALTQITMLQLELTHVQDDVSYLRLQVDNQKK